jgi:hypothetical protein
MAGSPFVAMFNEFAWLFYGLLCGCGYFGQVVVVVVVLLARWC